GARREEARPALAAVIDGDQLAAVQQSAAVSALRVLSVLYVRIRREVDLDGDNAADRRSDGQMRNSSGELCRTRRDERTGPRDRRVLLRLAKAHAFTACESGGAVRERRGVGASASECASLGRGLKLSFRNVRRFGSSVYVPRVLLLEI